MGFLGIPALAASEGMQELLDAVTLPIQAPGDTGGVMINFEVTIKIGKQHHTQVLSHPDDPNTWTPTDCQDLLNLFCSLIRPEGATFIYAFPPARDGSGGFEMLVKVDDDFLRSAPLPLQKSVVTEMVRRAEGGHA